VLKKMNKRIREVLEKAEKEREGEKKKGIVGKMRIAKKRRNG